MLEILCEIFSMFSLFDKIRLRGIDNFVDELNCENNSTEPFETSNFFICESKSLLFELREAFFGDPSSFSVLSTRSGLVNGSVSTFIKFVCSVLLPDEDDSINLLVMVSVCDLSGETGAGSTIFSTVSFGCAGCKGSGNFNGVVVCLGDCRVSFRNPVKQND